MPSKVYENIMPHRLEKLAELGMPVAKNAKELTDEQRDALKKIKFHEISTQRLAKIEKQFDGLAKLGGSSYASTKAQRDYIYTRLATKFEALKKALAPKTNGAAPVDAPSVPDPFAQ